MYKLERLKEIFIVHAKIPFKNRIKEEELRLVFDPGCAVTLVDTSIVDLLGYSAQIDSIRLSHLEGAGGRSKGYIIEMPRFKSLNQELHNFEIACHDLDSHLGISGLLGMNFFKHFKMDIDFSKGLICSIHKV